MSDSMARWKAAARGHRYKGWTLLVLLGLWLTLAGEDPFSWLVGLPAVAVALWVMSILPASRPWRIRLGELPGFILFFSGESFRAGIDVALRAFRPRRELHPNLVRYSMRLPEGACRVFLMNSISLTPGTFSADCQGHVLQVHVLDEQRPVAVQIARLEGRVARLFGIEHVEEWQSDA